MAELRCRIGAGGIAHARYAGELILEMRESAQIRLRVIEKTEGPLQQGENLRLVMLPFGANLDQLDKVGGGLRPQMMSANSSECICDRYFAQRVQGGFATERDRNLGFEKQVEPAAKRTLRPARTAGDSLDHAQRIGAPGDDRTGVTQPSFAQDDSTRRLHREQ